MSSTAETPDLSISASPEVDPGQVCASIAGRWETGFVILLLAVAQQVLGHHTADNAWLIMLCEEVLNGKRAYVDLIETNPPASFLIYMAPVFIARILHLSSEFVVSVSVFAGAFGAIALSASIARRAGQLPASQTGLFYNSAIFALLFLPGITFAQREHVAVIAILPLITLYAARMSGHPARLSHAIACGLLAGLAVCIKPYFALAMALPLVIVLWRKRSVRPAFCCENWCVALVVLAYGALLVSVYAEFFNWLPAILDTYAAIKIPLPNLLGRLHFLVPLIMIGAMFVVLRARDFDPLALLAGAAVLGFSCAILLQGKGWVNHYLPGAILGFIALARALASDIAACAKPDGGPVKPLSSAMIKFVLLPLALLLPLLFGAHQQFAMKEEYPGLTETVRKLTPVNPKITALSAEVDAGFPLVRNVEGRWASRNNTMWLMAYAQLLLDRGHNDRQKMQAYIDLDAKMFAGDVRNYRPDAILVDSGPHIEKMLRHPEIAGVLKAYRPAAKVQNISVWVPRR